MSLLQYTCVVEAEVDADSVASPCDPEAKISGHFCALDPFRVLTSLPFPTLVSKYKYDRRIVPLTATPTQDPIRART